MNTTDRLIVEKITADLKGFGSDVEYKLQDFLSGDVSRRPTAAELKLGLRSNRVPGQRYAFEEGYRDNKRQQELVADLFRFLYQEDPDLLILYLIDLPNRFFYYMEAGIPESFMVQDVESALRCMTQGYDPEEISYIREYSVRDMFRSIERHVPELFQEIKSWRNSPTDVRQLGALLLEEVCGDSKQVEQLLIPYVEQYLEKRKQGDGGCCGILFVVYKLAWGIKESLNQYIREKLMECPARFPELVQSGSSAGDYLDMCQKFEIPAEGEIRFHLYIMTGKVTTRLSSSLARLKELLQIHYDEFRDLYYRLLEEQELAALTAYAILRSHAAFQAEAAADIEKLREQMERLILAAHERMYQEAPGLYDFDGEKEGDFLSVMSPDPDRMKIHFQQGLVYQIMRKYQGISILTTSCYLLDELNAARNTVMMYYGMGMESYYRNWLGVWESYKLFKQSEESQVRMLERGNVPISFIFCLVMDTCHGNSSAMEPGIKKDLLLLLKERKQEAEEIVRSSRLGENDYINYLYFLYQTEQGFDDSSLAFALEVKNKKILETVEELLKSRSEGARRKVEELSQSKIKATADAAARLIRYWDNDLHKREMDQLNHMEELETYISKLYTKNNEKAVPFAKLIDYGQVREKDGERHVSAEVMKYYISEYLLLKEFYVVNICAEIQNRVNLYDLRNLIREIYETWLSEGTGARYKNILLPYALCAGNAQLETLKKQISEWADNSKPGMAELAVRCMALNGSREALMMVDTMGKKHKNKRVRKAAVTALEYAMGEFGITKEELEDLIVPDLGFSKDRTRMFSYGEREFKAVLGTDLTIHLYDGDKEIRTLPKASEKYGDKEEAAAAAKEELKAIKKQCKVVMEAQKPRLEQAVFAGRGWKRDQWETLFIGNPLMYSFAAGLIWGEEDGEGQILGTFRFLEDGSFNTVDEEEYELHENSRIVLLHPADMDPEEVENWKTQLKDYEVTQPVEQLELPVCRLSTEELEQFNFPVGAGINIYGGTVRSIAGKAGGTVSFSEYGSCDGFMCEFPKAGFNLYAEVDPAFYPGEYNVVTTLKKLWFRRIEGGQAAELKTVPKRLQSFAAKILQQFEMKKLEDID